MHQMARKVKIPPSQRPYLLKIAEMDDGAFEILHKFIANLEPKLYVDALNKQLAGDNILQVVPQASDFLNLLTGIARSYYSMEQEREDLIRNIALTLGEEETLSENNCTKLGDRLEKLLSQKGAIMLSARTSLLATSYEKTYKSARLITDLRPIFTDGEVEMPLYCLSTHSLKIEFHEDGNYKDIYITLDNDDLRQLVEVLDRGLKKAELVQKMTTELKLPLLTNKD